MRIFVRFYEELNDFLPAKDQKRELKIDFNNKRSVKDFIEAFGIPHTEVDLILINGKSVDFEYLLQTNDHISVYPVFETLNISGITGLRKFPLRKTAFVAEINIGSIVKLMRMLGFDITVPSLQKKSEIINISNDEHRIILTKSRRLLMNKHVVYGMLIRNENSLAEVKRIVDYLDIKSDAKPFSRCICCNTSLTEKYPDEVINKIPLKARNFQKYHACPTCNKIYWQGSHFEKMQSKINSIMDKF